MAVAHIIFDAFGTLVRRTKPLSFRHYPLENASTAMIEVRDWSFWADRHGATLALQQDLDSIVLYEDADTTLKTLRNRKIDFSVMSNLASCYGEPLKELMSPYLPKYWFLSYMDGMQKPHPLYYLYALKTLGLPAHSVLFVGDTPKDDVQGPRECGMQSVLVKRHLASLSDTVLNWVECNGYS